MKEALIKAACIRAELEMEAMKAANKEREANGEALKYNEDHFMYVLGNLNHEIYETRQQY